MTPIEKHKRRILASIKANEKRKETHPPKDRKVAYHRPRHRYRFDTYLPWEVNHAVR